WTPAKVSVRRNRWIAKSLHLEAHFAFDRRQQPVFADAGHVADVPVIGTHYHDGQVGQINQRADTEREQNLARPQITDLVATDFRFHQAFPPSASTTAFTP